MGDLGSIPRLGKSPGEGKGYPLQYSGVENSMDCSPQSHKELDKTERLSFSLLVYPLGQFGIILVFACLRTFISPSKCSSCWIEYARLQIFFSLLGL